MDWNIAMELREGSWHGQKSFALFSSLFAPGTQTDCGEKSKLLLWLDGGHDGPESEHG